eukprot:6486596-Amphidinium_carterae.1
MLTGTRASKNSIGCATYSLFCTNTANASALSFAPPPLHLSPNSLCWPLPVHPLRLSTSCASPGFEGVSRFKGAVIVLQLNLPFCTDRNKTGFPYSKPAQRLRSWSMKQLGQQARRFG